MKTTKDNVTNNQIFALRMRADDAGNTELVKTIDRWLEEREDKDLEIVLRALQRGPRLSRGAARRPRRVEDVRAL
jgi:hypothetical protein